MLTFVEIMYVRSLELLSIIYSFTNKLHDFQKSTVTYV